MEKFFQAAASWAAGTQEYEVFTSRFEQVFLTCEAPPNP
jgi:hypothetical protein